MANVKFSLVTALMCFVILPSICAGMFGDNILSSTPADYAPITITVTGLPTTVTLAVVKVANNTVPAVSNSARLCYNGSASVVPPCTSPTASNSPYPPVQKSAGFRSIFNPFTSLSNRAHIIYSLTRGLVGYGSWVSLNGYGTTQRSAANRSTSNPITLAKDSAHYAPGIINTSVASDSIALLQNYRLSKFDHRDAVPDCSICEKIPFIWSPIIGLCVATFSAFYLFINWEPDTGHQRLNGYITAATLAWIPVLIFMIYFEIYHSHLAPWCLACRTSYPVATARKSYPGPHIWCYVQGWF